jgi:hypothetical protein
MTDSVPRTAANLAARPPFEILSLAAPIARLLMEDGQALL